MVNYKEHLFADYEVHSKSFTITCDRDKDGNFVETDIMHLFLKKDFKYLYNVELSSAYSEYEDFEMKINGIKIEGNNGSSCYSLENVLVQSFTVNRDCSFFISYNL